MERDAGVSRAWAAMARSTSAISSGSILDRKMVSGGGGGGVLRSQRRGGEVWEMAMEDTVGGVCKFVLARRILWINTDMNM